ncbi:MAG TPA: proline--tRNA ligase [Candidatus Dormibacteraeota bacterium]
MSATQEESTDFVKDITKMSDDFDRWYTDVVRKAELADWSGIRGMMVIRPYGWAIWEQVQRAFDDMIKESGHENWAFPLLIPREYLAKEAEHIEGFGPEVAWVTKAGADMEELDEPLAVRPTSETIIGPLIKRYIQSHRDLPKLTNQWGSVMRWEMRSRLFLRTREFWWQEGHTFHATSDEAKAEVALILEYYRQIVEEWLAIPGLTGRKSDSEKFAGADYTLSVESMMRDGLALQMATSHYFGQNFSRAYDIAFTNRDNQRELCYTTSWGLTTRTVGAVVMAHGDDSGLVLPPKVAPVQVAVVPIFRNADERALVEGFLDHVVTDLKAHKIRHKVDWRDDVRPGDKFAHWELRGVPLRLEVGPRDVAAGHITCVDRLTREKTQLEAHFAGGVGHKLVHQLEDFQARLYQRALEFRDARTVEVSTLDELVEAFKAGPVFAWARWCGDPACEAKVKEVTGGATTRNYREDEKVEGACIVDGRPATIRIVFAKAY